LPPTTRHASSALISCAEAGLVVRTTSKAIIHATIDAAPLTNKMLLVLLGLKERLFELTFNADEPFFRTSGTFSKIIRFCLKFACSFFGRAQL
jgi:hypothetical protein